jgi:hypothetical protein
MWWLNSLDPLKTLFVVQFVVQAVLLCIVVYLMVVDKRRSIPTSALDELETVIGQTAQLTEDFRTQIQAKVDLVARAMTELDAKILEAKAAAEALEKASAGAVGEEASKARETRTYTPSDVARLHKAGFGPVDISQITGIPVGEVQLMVKVNQEGSL